MRYALLSTLLFALPALAGDEEKDERSEYVARHDTDGDGRLSLDEFGRERDLFELLDRNRDGFLAADELPKPRAERREKGARDARDPSRLLEMHDGDKDGRLSAAEWPESARLPFAKADGNADGFVDQAELRQAFAGRGKRPERPQREAPDAEQVQRLAQGLLKRLDKDGDGKVVRGEVPEDGRFDFEQADANRDGAVDLLEITASIQARFAGRGERDGGPDQMIQRLKQLDANGDGAVDRNEWKGPPELFQRLDADQDGTISAKEMKLAAREAQGRWSNRAADAAFRRFDTDADGKISAEEWKARPELFQRFDADGDGFITREEITPKGPAGGKRARQLDLRSGKDSAHFLAQHDANGDGQVTKAEFPHERRFAEIDVDGDGVLSREEIEDAMDKVSREEAYGFLERFDLDADGKVTRDEFTGAAATFERMDRNNDGVIDKADGVE